MRLIRLFLILLLSISLPFANVAAAAMVHCAQPATESQSIASDHIKHSANHANHAEHAAVQEQGTAGQQPHNAFNHNDVGCSNCSYCQSCASAIVPPLASQSVRIEARVIVKTSFTDLVPRIFLEEPFRPPALAFA